MRETDPDPVITFCVKVSCCVWKFVLFSGRVASLKDVKTEADLRGYGIFWAKNWKNGRASCIWCHEVPGISASFSVLTHVTGAKHHARGKIHFRLRDAMECEVTPTNGDVGDTNPDTRRLEDRGMFAISFGCFRIHEALW